MTGISEMRIDRCVCFDYTFEQLRVAAARHSASSVLDLQQHVEFGLKCTLCHPYVRRMLQTGEVVFFDLIENEDDLEIDP